MEVIQDKIYEFQRFWDWAISISDPRVKDWPFMQSYIPTIALTILYIVSIYGGKRIMANREPIKFKYTLFFYNLVLIILNFHISSTLLISAYRVGYSIQCQPVTYSNDPNELNIASALWWFYISKLVEMLDTIFFMLRKKNNQISFLHVYHHATMFPLWWIGVKWVAGGQSFFGAMINSFIHVLMYSYYGLSALGPHMQKYLWWKRYLTILQLLQFFVGMVYGIQSLYLGCHFPLWMQYTALVYGVTIITLFLNFYIQAYLKKPHTKIQFVVGIVHAAQSLYFQCDFPEWMHWALCFYAFTILMLFLNFYFHAYIKSLRHKQQQKEHKEVANGEMNGKIQANGDCSNGVSSANGHIDTKKNK